MLFFLDNGAPDNAGREFIVGYLVNQNWPANAALRDVELYISTSSSTDVSVRVTTPAITGNSAMDEKFTITGGELYVYFHVITLQVKYSSSKINAGCLKIYISQS